MLWPSYHHVPRLPYPQNYAPNAQISSPPNPSNFIISLQKSKLTLISLHNSISCHKLSWSNWGYSFLCLLVLCFYINYSLYNFMGITDMGVRLSGMLIKNCDCMRHGHTILSIWTVIIGWYSCFNGILGINLLISIIILMIIYQIPTQSCIFIPFKYPLYLKFCLGKEDIQVGW